MRRTGILVLLAGGLYYAWQNRLKIRHFLENRGFNIPIDTRNLRTVLKSGYERVRKAG